MEKADLWNTDASLHHRDGGTFVSDISDTKSSDVRVRVWLPLTLRYGRFLLALLHTVRSMQCRYEKTFLLT